MNRALNRLEIRACDNVTFLDGSPSGLVRVSPALGSHHIGLVIHGFSWDKFTVLEDDGCIAEYEVHGASDKAIPVKLAV